MPRVNALTADKKIQENLIKVSERCIAECALLGITYTEIAELLNVSPQAISQQMKKKHISLSTWLAVEQIKGDRNVKNNVCIRDDDVSIGHINAR